MCLCKHTTADHAGHGKAECLFDPCPCPKMNPQGEIELVKKKYPLSSPHRTGLPMYPKILAEVLPSGE